MRANFLHVTFHYFPIPRGILFLSYSQSKQKQGRIGISERFYFWAHEGASDLKLLSRQHFHTTKVSNLPLLVLFKFLFSSSALLIKILNLFHFIILKTLKRQDLTRTYTRLNFLTSVHSSILIHFTFPQLSSSSKGP